MVTRASFASKRACMKMPAIRAAFDRGDSNGCDHAERAHVDVTQQSGQQGEASRPSQVKV